MPYDGTHVGAQAVHGVTREGFDNCTREQQGQLLNWFFYRAKPEQRTALANALPQAYNAFVGLPVAVVTFPVSI